MGCEGRQLGFGGTCRDPSWLAQRFSTPEFVVIGVSGDRTRDRGVVTFAKSRVNPTTLRLNYVSSAPAASDRPSLGGYLALAQVEAIVTEKGFATRRYFPEGIKWREGVTTHPRLDPVLDECVSAAWALFMECMKNHNDVLIETVTSAPLTLENGIIKGVGGLIKDEVLKALIESTKDPSIAETFWEEAPTEDSSEPRSGWESADSYCATKYNSALTSCRYASGTWHAYTLSSGEKVSSSSCASRTESESESWTGYWTLDADEVTALEAACEDGECKLLIAYGLTANCAAGDCSATGEIRVVTTGVREGASLGCSESLTNTGTLYLEESVRHVRDVDTLETTVSSSVNCQCEDEHCIVSALGAGTIVGAWIYHP